MITKVMDTTFVSNNTEDSVCNLYTKFPIFRKYNISRYNNDFLIIYKDNICCYYNKNDSTIHITNNKNVDNLMVLHFIINSDNDNSKIYMIRKIFELWFGIKLDKVIIDNDIFYIEFIKGDTKYCYNIEFIDKDYFTLTLRERIEMEYGYKEICNSAF